MQSLFRPGQNCAALAHAKRVGMLVDAEAYYRAFMDAARRAERSIIILAWDFDSRTPLGLEQGATPILLGDFLNSLAKSKTRLRIRILNWDFPIVYGTDRELPVNLGLAWKPHRRIDFQFDNTHPVAGSHHQKIVVIDDTVAFVGGLDLTNKRWDTPAHLAGDPRRVFDGEPYPPMHDVMMVVDDKAAAALGGIARERWRNATGQRLKAQKVESDAWPEDVAVEIRNVEVGIACTAPPIDDTPEVRQVERLYLDMIARAQSYIYIENQYFTSQRISAALAERLAHAEAPEIVLVTRLLSHGWLEEKTMTVLRARYVRELRAADVHGRFHACCPHISGLASGTCIDLHSKVMIVDDEWLRIGSSNLSNRSMGMDTECDVTVEARGTPDVQRTIRGFRDRLIAEHTGEDPNKVAQAIEAAGGIAGAIATLGSKERRLKILEAPELSDATMALAGIGDPEKPIFESVAGGMKPAMKRGRHFPLKRAIAAFILLAAIVLALVWTRTPLADYLTRENALEMAQGFAKSWWTPIVLVLAYIPASFIMFPRWIITLTAVVMFGPWIGLVLALCGCASAGVATFLPGRLVSRETVNNLAGERLQRIARVVQRRGLIAVTLLRLVPIAPFPVVNLALGALRIRLLHFVVGTILGMAPGTIATTVLSDQVAAALEDPGEINGWLVAAAIGTLLALAYFGQRWLRRNPA
jgi:phosphatidylserine/phosphatidylglycerophosphate/cardiolipin synthase-like enzyme/uncharacterized membrane protein YdjX (TVP38/TMEM64 family)